MTHLTGQAIIPPHSWMPDQVLVVDDPLFELHAPSSNHPERPARLDAARAGVARSGVRTRALPAEDADRGLLERAHAPRYLDALDQLRGASRMIDADTYVSPRSVEAAVRAAGGAAALARALLAGAAQAGVALLRPPGHHAERGRAGGFCLLNNVAVAAHAAHVAGARRVAIVDIDVHHGNGTQAIFWEDPDTVFVSLHQSPSYPGTGAVDERGGGAGVGATINVPLDAGAGDQVYIEAVRRIVRPVLEELAPGIVLMSVGFDAFEDDPLADMQVTPAGFGAVVGAVVETARSGGKPIGVVLEGGYDLAGIEACMAATCRALLDGGSRLPRSDAPIAPAHRMNLDRAAVAARERWSGVR